jgi:Amt family ammonium transporter
MAGIFVSESFGGAGYAEGMTMGSQLNVQLMGIGFTIVFTAVVTWIVLKIVDAIVGLRVDEDQETEGLDINQHDERGYIL